MFKLLKQRIYFKPIILLTIIYGIGNLNFYGISYCLDMEGAGYGINNVIAGCVEIVSYGFLSNFVIIQIMSSTGCLGKRELLDSISWS